MIAVVAVLSLQPIVAGIAIDRVVSVAGEQCVVAGFAEQLIVADAADQLIVADAAENEVVAAATAQEIVTVFAVDFAADAGQVFESIVTVAAVETNPGHARDLKCAIDKTVDRLSAHAQNGGRIVRDGDLIGVAGALDVDSFGSLRRTEFDSPTTTRGVRAIPQSENFGVGSLERFVRIWPRLEMTQCLPHAPPETANRHA